MKNTMRLQSIGIVPAVPAGILKKGDRLMWNFGCICIVNEILSETEHFITISESPETPDRYCDYTLPRKLKKDRLVCLLGPKPSMKVDRHIKLRLEELRTELRMDRISTGELIELQSLSEYIEPGDVELLEAAGVPEFKE